MPNKDASLYMGEEPPLAEPGKIDWGKTQREANENAEKLPDPPLPEPTEGVDYGQPEVDTSTAEYIQAQKDKAEKERIENTTCLRIACDMIEPPAVMSAKLKFELDKVNRICASVDGELISRQVIAMIVARHVG